MEYTKTELHTHLVGIMSADEFVKFIKNQGITQVKIDYNNPEIPVDDLLKHENYLSLLRIKKGQRYDMDRCNLIYQTRTYILNYAFKKLVEMGKYTSNSQASKVFFNDFINESLKSLVNAGVEYAEISYSFPDRINNFKIDEKLKDKIKIKFLLSTQRSTPAKNIGEGKRSFESLSKDLRKCLKNGNAVGFDIMGEERALTMEELDPKNEIHSIYKKLDILFDELLKLDNTTLRIHSGETNESSYNTLLILKIIELISKNRGIKVPPPEIRIGHGVHFVPNQEYINYMKNLKCIVEINASSNYALSHIKDYKDIPYQFYLSNGIPIVISTDGGGVYETDIKLEDSIAYVYVPYNYKEVLNIDSNLKDKKVSR